MINEKFKFEKFHVHPFLNDQLNRIAGEAFDENDSPNTQEIIELVVSYYERNVLD
jgi:uncharacterized protein YozE (UPF0346 family)|tara:strand:+ start:275 stop:439 length:165 start_codon:yes stop_codon:yes gene_type:complete